MDWKTISSQYVPVMTIEATGEPVAECTICWSFVVESSKRLHLEYHAKRQEFTIPES